MGAAFAKGLTLKMGQTHMHKYMPILLERIERGEIDPSFIITHRIGLEDAPAMYRTFRDKDDACIKVVMKPGRSVITVVPPHMTQPLDTKQPTRRAGIRQVRRSPQGDTTWLKQARSTMHFIDELRDSYDAEKQLTKALPKLAKAAVQSEAA